MLLFIQVFDVPEEPRRHHLTGREVAAFGHAGEFLAVDRKGQGAAKMDVV